jgi:hypothetical protein
VRNLLPKTPEMTSRMRKKLPIGLASGLHYPNQGRLRSSLPNERARRRSKNCELLSLVVACSQQFQVAWQSIRAQFTPQWAAD